MIKEGARLLIDGVPYRIISATEGSTGRYLIVIEHDNSGGTDLRNSIANLMDSFDNSDDKFSLSKKIIAWFVDEKLKSGINTDQIMRIKAKSSTAEGQIRRLMKNGQDVPTIIEVLAFSITDKFWSGILNTSINTIAVPRDDGITLYEKIKSKMVASRHADQTEIHQTTEEDMAGVIVTE